MNIIKGSEITSSHLAQYFSSIDNICLDLNTSVYNSYNSANMLYNHSSVIEDILSSNMLSLYNKLNSIAFTYTGSSVVFIESFESLEYLDKKFHVDKALNVDTANRALTLPVKNTIVNEIVSAIVEPDSNGTPGNALRSYQNSELESIFDGSLSSLFEYEKYTSIFDASSLSLVLTLKLAKYAITNSIYIKMYSESSIKYPTIEAIEVSTDGSSWKEVNGFVNTFSEQNDIYIRYEAEKTRYIRVKFYQQVAQSIQTGFGIKNRYSIGIREIQVITNEFESNGAYVSIPLSIGKPITTVSLQSDYISSNGISFNISANNGGTWLPIVADGRINNILDMKTGVMLSENLRSLRVKIGMQRTAGSSLLKSASQLYQYTQGGTYQLAGMPSNMAVEIGGFISCGGINKYLVSAPYPFNILDVLYVNSGIKISSGGSYDATFGNEVSPRVTSSSMLGVKNSLRDYIFANKNTMYLFNVKYVPYFDGIDDDLELFIGSQLIPREINNDGVISILWIAVKDYNSKNTNIYIDIVNLQLMQKVGSDTIINGSINNGISLQFKQKQYDPSLSDTRNIITLNYNLLSTKSSDIIVTEYKNGLFVRQLFTTEYSVKQGTRNTVIINEEAFSSISVYEIAYMPSFDVTDLFLSPSEMTSSLAETSYLIDAPVGSRLSFEYTYEDQQVTADTRYYSPICKNYKIEIA